MIEPFLISNNLMGYVDGSISCPSKTLSVIDGATVAKESPNYPIWVSYDAHVRMLIISTISEASFRHVQGTTSRDLWLSLEKAYTPHSTSIVNLVYVDDIIVTGNPDTYLEAFSYADWAGDSDDRRSTRRFVIYLGSNLISWSAHNQRTVSRSSTEAEYKAFADTVVELTWLQALLNELGIRSSSTPILWCDNFLCIYIPLAMATIDTKPPSHAAYDMETTMKCSEPQNDCVKNHGVVDATLRAVLFATTNVAVIAMVTSKETNMIPISPTMKVPLDASFNRSPAYIYYVSAITVACLYSIITCMSSVLALMKKGGNIMKLQFYLEILDSQGIRMNRKLKTLITVYVNWLLESKEGFTTDSGVFGFVGREL
uniref:CASP-like protein n=1 Tax=Tanacetum cinerariifolium TaxID=118510 RepID=A0A6L2JLK2_TANCI|nr:CASP-like protein 1 [Tanacetum cinerariifolium]